MFKDAFPQYQGPVPTIDEGFGAEGPYKVAINILPSPLWPEMNVSVYHPVNTDSPVPVIFFAHGFNANYAFVYHSFLQHLASRGYVVVFSPYPGMSVSLLTPETVLERYEVMWQGFKKPIQEFPDMIDSTRIGIIGHSFGGGAVPSMTKRAITAGWGNNGCFMMPLAPWYFYDISETDLRNFAPQAKLLMQVYEEDIINDHRLAIDIFNHISIPDSEKDFTEVFSDQIDGYYYHADHGLPETLALYNALDSYAVFRLADALADYALKGDQEAKTEALGNGSQEQINMGLLKPLLVSDNPFPGVPSSNYVYRCDNPLNPRAAFCDGLGVDETNTFDKSMIIFPNPCSDFLFVESNTVFMTGFMVQIIDLYGRNQGSQIFEPCNSFSLDISDLRNGLYLLKINSGVAVYQEMFIVQKK
jgi:hypothetical protein